MHTPAMPPHMRPIRKPAPAPSHRASIRFKTGRRQRYILFRGQLELTAVARVRPPVNLQVELARERAPARCADVLAQAVWRREWGRRRRVRWAVR